MSERRKLMWAGLAVWLLCVGASVAAEPAKSTGGGVSSPAGADAAETRTLVKLAVGAGAEGPIVTLSGDSALEYKAEVLSDPHRLILDLPATVTRLDRNQFSVGTGGVVRVRAGQFRSGSQPVSRVVFDLDGPVPHRIDRAGDDLVVTFGGHPSGIPLDMANTGSEPVAAAEATEGSRA